MPIAQPGLAELQRLCDDSSAAPLLLLLTCSAHPRCNEAARVEALYSLERAALNYSSGSLRFARTEGANFPLSALNLRGTDLPAMVLFNAPSTHVCSQAAVVEAGGWRPEAVPHFVDAARKGAAPPFVRSQEAPPLSLGERTLQIVSAASLAEARTSMRQIVLLLHEPRGRQHRHHPPQYHSRQHHSEQCLFLPTAPLSTCPTLTRARTAVLSPNLSHAPNPSLHPHPNQAARRRACRSLRVMAEPRAALAMARRRSLDAHGGRGGRRVQVQVRVTS